MVRDFSLLHRPGSPRAILAAEKAACHASFRVRRGGSNAIGLSTNF